MAALLNCFKQVWTSIVDAFKGCCGKTDDEAPATTPVEITTAPSGEVIIGTRDITSGGGGKTNADVLSVEQYTSSGGTGNLATDQLAASMITSGGGGKTN